MQFSVFKKPEQKELMEMTKTERKDFLECDLMERMIRIEQKVRSSFETGVIPYYDTDYYKELSASDKKRFKKYIENKHKKKNWNGVLMVSSFLFILLFRSRITGNAIYSGESATPLDIAVIIILLLILIVLIINTIMKNKRWKRLEKHFSVILKSIDKKKPQK